jgi:TP901 family phage tail tape measure protein
MALVDVQFRANANFADLIAQVNAANAAVKNLNTSFAMMGKSGGIDDLVREFSSGLAASRQYTTETVRLRNEAEKFGEALHKQRLELRDYHREYRNFVSGRKSMITELARQQTMLERSMVVTRGRDAKGQAIADVITPTGLDNSLATRAAVARKELQIMNKVLNDGATAMINWGKNTQWAGRQLTVGLTVPLTLLGGAAAKLAYDLDKEMTRIVKVYGNTMNTMMGPATVNQLRKDLMGLSGDLAKVYGQSAQETLGLAAEFAAAGKQGDELMQSVTQTTRLATLGEVDRAEAMKATLAIQTAFKSNTEELAESINFLNAVENQTNTTLNDLVEAIPKAGPIVKGLGGDIKELSLLVVAMREGGIPAAEAANALKSGLASLINPTKQAREMLKGYNIDIDAVIANSEGKLIPMVTGFQAELDKLDEFSRQKVIEQIFGKYQFARMGALFANLGRDGSQTVEVMKLMGAEAGELASIADRELGALQESISGQFTRALEQVKVELAQIGEGFLVLATKGLNAINWLFEKFDMLPDFVKTGIGGVLTVTAIIGPIIMTTGVLGNLLGYLVKGVAWFKTFGKSGVTAYDHLTKESVAAKLAGETLEKSFYDQAKAVTALDAGINKLIASLTELAGAGKAASTSVSTGAATTAEKAKQAFVGGRGRGLIDEDKLKFSTKSGMGGVEVSHLYPTALTYTGSTDAEKEARTKGDKAVVMSSMLNTGTPEAEFQRGLQTNFAAASIVSLDESMEDIATQRRVMLQAELDKFAARPLQRKETSADRARIVSGLQAKLDAMSNDAMARLLPSKQAFKEVNLKYLAFMQSYANMAEGTFAGDPQQKALVQARAKQYAQEYKLAVKNGVSQMDAYADLMQKVMNDPASGFREMYTNAIKAYEDILASGGSAEQMLLKLRQQLDALEARARAAVAGVVSGTGLTGVAPGVGNNRGTAQLGVAVPQQQYYQAGLFDEDIVEKLDDAADMQADAAKEQSKAAKTQSVAAVMNVEAETAELGGAAGGAGGGTGVIVGGSGAGEPKRGRFRGLMGNRWVQGAGVAAGVGLMSAGMSGDGALGAAGTVAGGAMTGGMIGSMFAPVIGTAIGAAVGGLASAIPLIISNMQRAQAELASVQEVGETAFDKLGASIKSAKDVALIPFNEGLEKSGSAVAELIESFKNAPEGSVDANFIELLKGENDMGNMRGLLEDKVVELQAAGVEMTKIKEYILAALTASGRGTDAAGLIPDIMNYAEGSAAGNLKNQLKDYLAARKIANEILTLPQSEQQAALAGGDGTPGGLFSDETLEAAKAVYSTMLDISATKAPVDLQKFLNEIGGDLPSLKDVMDTVPESMKGVAQSILDNGGSAELVLKALNLNAQGIALNLDKISANPWYVDVVFRETVGDRAIMDAITAGGTGAFADRMAAINKAYSESTTDTKATNDAAIKAQEDHIDALRKKYDDQIEAEKKKQEALDEAQEAEERRLSRQKTLRDLQVSYNEAISSGNLGAAALIKNEVAYTKAEWAREDKERIADKASESRIEAIEKERDAAIEAEQAKLEAMRANQAAMNDAVTTGTNGRKAQEIKAVEDAKAAWDAIIAEYPGDFEGMAAALKEKGPIFAAAGVNIGDLMKEAIGTATSQGTAQRIFDTVGGNLAKAPWDLVANLAAAKAMGDTQKVISLQKNLDAWVETFDFTDKETQKFQNRAGVSDGGAPSNSPSRYSSGGLATGPGHGTSDDIDAKLSNGEFVMTNASVNYYGKGFMDAINQRKFAAGGLVTGMGRAMMKGVMAGAVDKVAQAYGAMTPDGFGVTNDVGMPGAQSGGGGVTGTGLGAQIAALGARYVGVPYSYTGGSPEDGWGCAPFVRWVYQRFGFNLPGGSVSNSQYNAIKSRPNRNEITAGDLLFFKYANGVNLQNPINHVGLYMGGGNMVHAANKQKGTIISPVDWANYVAAGRPINYDTRKPNYARGGLVGMIEPGEFMVQKEAVQHYGEGFLNAINQQTYHKGGLVTQSGPKHGLASGGGNQYNFTVYGDQKSAKELAREVVALIEQTNKRKRSNR